jgi:hypothetical protein
MQVVMRNVTLENQKGPQVIGNRHRRPKYLDQRGSRVTVGSRGDSLKTFVGLTRLSALVLVNAPSGSPGWGTGTATLMRGARGLGWDACTLAFNEKTDLLSIVLRCKFSTLPPN